MRSGRSGVGLPAFGVSLALLLVAAGASAQDLSPPPAQVGEALKLADFSVQQLDVPGQPGEQLAVRVRLAGVERVLHLRRHSLRSADFQLLVDDGRGLHAVRPPEPRTYRGFVLGVADSRVAASLGDGKLTAVIDLNEAGPWYVEPLAGLVSGATADQHLVYRGADVLPDYEHRCATDESDRALLAPGEDGGGGRATGNLICEIGLEADYPYFQKFGNLDSVVFDLESIYEYVETVYERDTAITFEITTIVVRTSSGSDPYWGTDPGSLLEQMGNVWRGELSGVRRDVAQLFTGRNLNGGVIGIAWLDGICSTLRGYSLCQSRFGGATFARRVALHAHELGHNWSATHCDVYPNCHIMCSVIDGCDGIGAPEFGPHAQAEIASFRNSIGCLDIEADPVAPPFYDEFLTSSLRTDLWYYNDGGVVSTNGLNEPSGPYALNLDSSGGRPYGDDDEIRSNFITLAGAQSINLSYYVEHRGVEAGERLYVEWWDQDTLDWKLINTVNSDGVDQNEFVFFEHALPAEAYDDTFRVRFRVDGNESNDDWYIDNVLVGEGGPPPPPVEHSLVEVPISPEAKADDPTLEHAQTFDLVASVANPGDDWTSTAATAVIDGLFYQHPLLDGDVPQTALWDLFPSLEFDSFWSAPNFGVPSFVEMSKSDSQLYALWFDVDDTGPGDHTIARYTVTSGTLLQVSGTTTIKSTWGYLWEFDVSANVDIPTGCAGDLDGDGDTDQSDLGILLGDWGCSGGGCAGDLDGDGDTDQSDLGILLGDWGCMP